ncbi:MAG: lytic murein transglycosylase [Pseudomonadota bacterium]
MLYPLSPRVDPRPLARAGLCAALLMLGLGADAAQPRTPQERHRLQVQQALRRAEADTPTYGARADVRAYAAELVARYPELPLDWVEAQLAQARLLPSVQRLIMPAPLGAPKDWSAYRARFIEPKRLQAGLEFWRDNERWLRAAEAHWGVPARVIVGIVGVETFYGRITGNTRLIDALATLSFDFPSGRSDKSPYFREELGHLLLLARRQNMDLQTLRGSYAGAVGWPQFMPGSWLKYGFDFDDDGRVDLQNSLADVIGSVAHYLNQHGWQRDMPTHYRVTPPPDAEQRARLLVPDIRPSFTAAELLEAGATLPPEGQLHADLLALVKLDNGGNPPSYIAGTQNFWTVTRYNHSSYYALAVIELGEAVAALREAESRPAADKAATPQ